MMIFSMRLYLNADVLWFCKESERFDATFTSDTTLFHATEGSAEITIKPSVHPDDPTLESVRGAMGTLQRIRPDRGGQTIRRAVRHRKHFVFPIEWDQRCHRTEDLFLIDATPGIDAFDQRWCNEETIRTPSLEMHT
jgi:hypothetical protein